MENIIIAIALLTKIIELNSKNTKAYWIRAQIYSAKNQSDLAIADYRQAITLDPKSARAYGSLGWQLILNGRFEEAHEPTEKAYALEPDESSWIINLGHLALLAGDRGQARKYYQQALKWITSDEQFEEGPIADLELFIKKGWAVEAAQQELNWLREVFGIWQPWLTMKKKTEQASLAKDYSTAESAGRATLEIAETIFGSDQRKIATSLFYLANVLSLAGTRYSEAESLLSHALAIQEKNLGFNHPDTAQTLDSLAGILQKQYRYNEAEPLLRQSLAISQNIFGPNHLNTAVSLNNLADVLQVLGRYNEAEQLYRRALSINEETLDSNDPETATTLYRLAFNLEDQGRFGEALPLINRTLQIRQKNFGFSNPDTIDTLNQLAIVISDMGRYNEAEGLFICILFTVAETHSLDDFFTAAILINLADVVGARGDYINAEWLFSRALAILEEKYNSEHLAIASSLLGLASALNAQGGFTRADKLSRRALSIH